MPEFSVVIVATDSEQRTIMQVLVDGTSVARTVTSAPAFPVAASDPVTRRVAGANPDVILVDIPADNNAPGDCARSNCCIRKCPDCRIRHRQPEPAAGHRERDARGGARVY
jgi:hypothetical protein